MNPSKVLLPCQFSLKYLFMLETLIHCFTVDDLGFTLVCFNKEFKIAKSLPPEVGRDLNSRVKYKKNLALRQMVLLMCHRGKKKKQRPSQ